jgi:serine O-acetyltransferase
MDGPMQNTVVSSRGSSLRCPPWDLADVVARLVEIRGQALAKKRLHANGKLPSRTAISAIVDDLSAALFPNRLGGAELSDVGVAYFIGDTLEKTLQKLMDQIRYELRFFNREHASDDGHDDFSRVPVEELAGKIVADFCGELPEIRLLLESDIQAAYEGDPAALSPDEVLLCYPGIRAIIHHRIAHSLNRLGAPIVARMIAERAHSVTGVDIHPGATIGASFFVDHGTGVVIGGTAIIGRRVRVYQGVTLGAVRFPVDQNGMLVKGNARHPIIEDDVVIYAGATILGRITIGSRSVIGGNVWLTRSVPPGSQISQARLRTEDFDSGGGI